MPELKILTEKTGLRLYFADPNSPGQRGTNKNTIALIRQYFSKGIVIPEEIKFT